MNEAALLRALRQYRKVRGPDFHQPATRANQGKLENGDGGIEKVGVCFKCVVTLRGTLCCSNLLSRRAVQRILHNNASQYSLAEPCTLPCTESRYISHVVLPFTFVGVSLSVLQSNVSHPASAALREQSKESSPSLCPPTLSGGCDASSALPISTKAVPRFRRSHHTQYSVDRYKPAVVDTAVLIFFITKYNTFFSILYSRP